MKKRKVDRTVKGPVSAFAFKAKQAPLQDLSNRSPTDRPAVQPPIRHDGIGGNCPTKPKAMVSVPSIPHTRPPKRRKVSNGLLAPVGTSDASPRLKSIIMPLNTPGQTSSAKTSDTNEGFLDEENRLDSSNWFKQLDTSNGFGSSNPGIDSPRLPSETLWPAFIPNPKNVTERTDSLLIQLQEGDTLAVLGQYDLWVRKGAVSLMSAILHANTTVYRVHAPSTHALPVIRCVPDPFSSTDQQTEIELTAYEDGLPLLRQVSTRLGGIWNSNQTPFQGPTPSAQSKARSFTPIYKNPEPHLKRQLKPLQVSVPWGSLLSRLSTTDKNSSPKIMVCGPKATGKSTFSRLTLNSQLSKAAQKRRQSKGSIDDGVALLDLDPGQPEFSPPGELSLVHLRSFVLGPPFTHPVAESTHGNQLVRAHHVAATSPKDDPDHYMACALDLMTHYRRLLQRNPTCPLVVNCSGWVYGSGLEVLTELILKLGITDVVYLSEAGPPEVVEELLGATKKARIPFHMLPSQPSEWVIRSASDLRAMQSLSYFHLAPSINGHMSWDHRPITSMAPWTVRYAGPDQGIVGIMVLGERQDPDYLAEILDGALVGVVVVEDDSAIPALGQDYITDVRDGESLENRSDGAESPCLNIGAVYQFPGWMNGWGDSDAENTHRLRAPFPSSSPNGMQDFDDMEQNTLSTDPFTDHPSVERTKNEDLPYLFSGAGTCTPVDPKNSHSLGLALIRGIDKESKTLHLITPIPDSTLEGFQKHKTKIVLVKGKLDTPAWAYQEEYCAATAAEKQRAGVEAKDAMEGSEDGELLEGRPRPSTWAGGVPWVRILNGPEARGRGAKVWRVRRDLKFLANSDDGMSD